MNTLYHQQWAFIPDFVEFTCIYPLRSLHGYHRDTIPISKSTLAAGLIGSCKRDSGKQVSPWQDFGTSVARKAFTWLWQCFLGSPCPDDGDPSARFVTTIWRPRQCEIQLGEIHPCNWNGFTWETAALRRLLAVTVRAHQSASMLVATIEPLSRYHPTQDAFSLKLGGETEEQMRFGFSSRMAFKDVKKRAVNRSRSMVHETSTSCSPAVTKKFSHKQSCNTTRWCSPLGAV